jgi:putative adenylate-forming enzyme
MPDSARLSGNPMSTLATLARVLVFRWRFGRWTEQDVRRWQARRAVGLARRAIRLPYYRELWRGHDPADVWNLPTTRKRDLMANLAGATTLGASWDELTRFREGVDAAGDYDRLFRGKYNVELSSGTSGAKGIFVFSPRERGIYGAMIAARNGVPRELFPVRAVLILRVDSPSLGKINTARISLRVLLLSTPIPDMVRALNEVAPNVLAGQPWVLQALAREQRAGRLRLRLGAVIPVAEVLDPPVREELADTFGAPVRELYQASEGIMASSCREGRLHINEDFVAVQLYDEAGRPARPGEPSRRMVVTDLYRRTQPIIRYELNDMIELDPERCPCGSVFRVVRRIHGRADDLLWGRDTAGAARPIFPDYFCRFIIRATEAIEEYQVTQVDPGRLRVRLLLKEGADAPTAAAAVRGNLARLYAEHRCVVPEIAVEFGAPQLHPESRKLRRVIRACEAPRDQN